MDSLRVSEESWQCKREVWKSEAHCCAILCTRDAAADARDQKVQNTGEPAKEIAF